MCVALWLWGLSALNPISDHKENVNKFQKGEVLEAIFFASNPISLETSYKDTELKKALPNLVGPVRCQMLSVAVISSIELLQ